MHADRTYLSLVTKIRRLNLVVLCLLHIVMASPQVYKPWLDKHDAKVLSLSCGAPSGISGSSDFGRLELYYRPFQDIERTQRLAYITTQMTKDQELPKSGKYLPISHVNFTGDWEKSARLSVRMPFKNGTYNCTYKRLGRDKIYLLSVRVEKFTEKPIVNDTFRVEITKAQMVSVTWKPPTNGKFQEARVWQRSVDNSGQDKKAAMTVFATIAWNSIYSDSVLLHRFEVPDKNENYSILLYVDEKLCRPKCRYSCFVPYPSCVQADAHLCDCTQAVTEEPNSEGEYEVEFITVLVIFILFIVSILIVVVICYVRIRGKKTICGFNVEIKRNKDRNLNGAGVATDDRIVDDVEDRRQPDTVPQENQPRQIEPIERQALLEPPANPNDQDADGIVNPPQQPEQPDDRADDRDCVPIDAVE